MLQSFCGGLNTSEKEAQLNSVYQGGSLSTYGLDVGYFITPVVNASVGYYYQNGDLGTPDGSGVLGRLAYEVSNGLTAGVNISYDEAFDTRVSADIKVRFGGASTTAKRKEVQQLPVINALTSTPSNRDVRVHDRTYYCGREIFNPTCEQLTTVGAGVWVQPVKN